VRASRAAAAVLAGFLAACDDPPKDPHIVPRPENLDEDRSFLSPPVLKYPIYACASSVVVEGFVPGAKIDVFADGNPAPIGSAQSWLSSQLVTVSISFTAGQEITAKQTFDMATSGPSNEVTVTSHTEDYPSGLPTPRIAPTPCYDCGRSLGIVDVVPGSWVKVFMEQARAGGGFDPEVEIGNTIGGSYAIVGTPFTRDSRLHVTSGLCTDTSPPSPFEIVQAEPPTIPAPTLDPVHEGVSVVVVRGPTGQNPLNGATLDVFSDPGMVRVGGQPTPGGAGQQVGISPAASTANTYKATQALCTHSVPGTPVTVVPCADQPPAKIKPPLPGDTQVEVTESIPGARILVFADGVEIGDGGAPVVVLSRPLAQGETIVVLQRIGTCDSATVYQTEVECALGGDDTACSADWPAFRHNALRSGNQAVMSPLADPYLVKKLEVVWRFPSSGSVGPFRASPVVKGGRVFIGSSDGHLYALDAATGAQLWQYPPSGPALTSQFVSNPSSEGIASSAFVTADQERREMVVFAAPDRSIGAGLGSGRLFALRPGDGGEIWKSPELARLTGTTRGSEAEFHEQFGYSSPLVFGRRVYGGIANHGDNPIQRGRVVAVDLSTGTPVGGFSFEATGTRGGGIWSAVAGGLEGGGIYVTTGNVRCWNGGCQSEPSPNHGLSMLRLNAGSGALDWKLQPVPFDLDGDPDWATGVHLLASSCGHLALSTMKDGWSYASRATSGSSTASVQWQFPNTGFPFTSGDGTAHGDSRYLHAGAVWNDVFFTETGGEGIVDDVAAGFGRLHALNVCAGSAGRVRWTADIPGASLGGQYQLGNPSVTRGIVFIGTTSGRLIALADPSRWPAQGSRCSRPDVSNADCVANGYALVPVPTVLRNLALGAGRIRGEPALAGNRVFVATEGGVVFMLEPRP
jgi:outer membrane protein assembly factor BamB